MRSEEERKIAKEAKATLNAKIKMTSIRIEMIEKLMDTIIGLPESPPPPPYMEIVEQRSFLLGQKDILESLSAGADMAEAEESSDGDDKEDECDCAICRMARGEDTSDVPEPVKTLLRTLKRAKEAGEKQQGPNSVANSFAETMTKKILAEIDEADELEKLKNMKGIPDA